MADRLETDEHYVTEEPAPTTDIRALGFINFVLGAWLIVTPYWFGYTTSVGRWDQTIIGIVVMLLAALRMLAPNLRWASFLTGIAGLWAIVAPFILGYNMAGAYWNEIIVGVIIAFLAFYNNSLVPTHTDRLHHTHA